MSPLATLAFELSALGGTGLKTGWVRCRHGAGRGGVGLGGWVGRGGVGVPWYKCCFLAPGGVCVSCVLSGNHFRKHIRLTNSTYFIAKYTQKAYLMLIYVQICKFYEARGLRCTFMVRIGAYVDLRFISHMFQ